MLFAFPLGLAALVALPVVWWLHRRQRPSRRTIVPSLAPWIQVAKRRAEPRRDAPFSLLLALRLGIALALGLALAGPTPSSGPGRTGAGALESANGASGTARPGGVDAGRLLHPRSDHLALVLDTSTSMAASDRWPTAVAKAEAWLARGGGPVSIVTFGGETLVRQIRTDAGSAKATLATLRPGGSDSSAAGAIAVARDLVGDGGRVVVITDGALRELPETAGLAAWEIVGPEAADPTLDNVALIRVASRRTPTGIALFAQAASFSQREMLAALRLVVDERTVEDRSITLSPGASTELRWQLPATAGKARLQLDAADALLADNEVTLPLQPWPLRVQVVPSGATRTEEVAPDAGRAAVERVLAALPDIEISRASAGNYRVDGSADASVFVGWQPESLPPGGVLTFQASTPTDSNVAVQSEPGDAIGDHPWMLDLDLAGVRFGGIRPLSVPGWAAAVLTSTAGVLVYAGEVAETRVAAFNFDPAAGNVATRSAFPFLVGRALAWAATRPRPLYRAGERVPLGSGTVVVASVFPSPSTAHQVMPAAGAFEIQGLPTLLEIRSGSGPSPRRSWSGVLAGDPFESDLHRPSVVASSNAVSPTAGGTGSLVPGLLVSALLLATAEAVVRSGWRPSFR